MSLIQPVSIKQNNNSIVISTDFHIICCNISEPNNHAVISFILKTNINHLWIIYICDNNGKWILALNKQINILSEKINTCIADYCCIYIENRKIVCWEIILEHCLVSKLKKDLGIYKNICRDMSISVDKNKIIIIKY